ncbi:hypothetical protein TIFTF001_029388 [Ficus carica]|uniref:Uncharacterized protein n=1 Tax=Ficus carica TaxID=3494 RepID=A0AA88DRN8_FICCA|nr:hypothetical protein TIFTF001_029388 [Ficus carica]
MLRGSFEISNLPSSSQNFFLMDIGNGTGAVTGGVSGVRWRTVRVMLGHCCQPVRDNVTQAIEGPIEQAALTSRLGCLVRINGLGPGHSMSGASPDLIWSTATVKREWPCFYVLARPVDFWRRDSVIASNYTINIRGFKNYQFINLALHTSAIWFSRPPSGSDSHRYSDLSTVAGVVLSGERE